MKSIEPLDARLPDGNVRALQQFIGQSPWEWDAVWERSGKRMTAEPKPDAAWVVDATGFPKQGSHSVSVSRQYSGRSQHDASRWFCHIGRCRQVHIVRPTAICPG